MALRQIRIGSAANVVQYDDADHGSAIEVDQPIKAGTPVDSNDVIRLSDLAGIILPPVNAVSIDNPTELNLIAGTPGVLIVVQGIVPATGLDTYTIYAYDASGPAIAAPYIMDAAGVGAERWIAIAGKYRISTIMNTLTTKNPPLDADLAVYRDSVGATWNLVTSTWTQVKAFLETYFDTLYGGISAVTASSAPNGLETLPTLSEVAGVISVTGNHRVWVKGVLYLKTTATVDLSAHANGIWYIYYDSSGVLQHSQTIWDFLITVPITIVYKNGASYFVMDERHGSILDVKTHDYLHYSRGTAWASGLVAAPGNTSLNLGTGDFYDEDLHFDITGANPYQVRVFYRDASLNWLWTAFQNNWWKAGVGGRPQWDDAGTLTELANAKYGVYYLVAINGYDTKIVSFMGQASHTTLAAARADTYGGMTWGTLPSEEIKTLYKIIVLATAASGTFVEVQDLRSNPQLVGTAPVLTDHGSLGGLSDPDHPASAIVNTPAGSIVATTVQAAIDELDTEKLSLTGGTTTGDMIRYNSISSAWEVKHEPLVFSQIILTPALAAALDAEGGMWYKSTDKSVYVCTAAP